MVSTVESIVDRRVSLRNRLCAICDSLALFCAPRLTAAPFSKIRHTVDALRPDEGLSVIRTAYARFHEPASPRNRGITRRSRSERYGNPVGQLVAKAMPTASQRNAS